VYNDNFEEVKKNHAQKVFLSFSPDYFKFSLDVQAWVRAQDPYMYWYQGIARGRSSCRSSASAGKDRESCRLQSRRRFKNKAYEVYAECRTEEAIAMAKGNEEGKCPLSGKPVVKFEKVMNRMTLRVNFDLDKSDIKESEIAELRKQLHLSEDIWGKVRLEGHTDNIATEEYNQKLSEKSRRCKRLLGKGRSLCSGKHNNSRIW
jgi:outer membrane protein OmpA-like peptidoglycan-associated protein